MSGALISAAAAGMVLGYSVDSLFPRQEGKTAMR